MNTRITWILHAFAGGAALIAVGCSGHNTGVADGTSGSSGGDGSSGSSGAGSSGSSGAHPSDSEALFQAPTGTATPDTIFGVWGGSLKNNGITFDSRMRLSTASATLATRCTLDSSGKTSGIVGVTAAARISGASLVILESKSDQKDDGVVRCSVKLAPREVKRCAADVTKGFERDCFTIEGTQFTDYGASSFDKVELTKLSD